MTIMYEAQFYNKIEEGKVECQLCPWHCVLNPGQTGNCKVRTNEKGKLISNVYNRVAALGVDPIEKKPLYHFYPGKNILSIGEVGCNLHCNFCQNHRISQCKASDFTGFHNISSEKIVNEALKTWNNIGIAYTYNEPFTFYEFMLDTAKIAHEKGLRNVVVSNGYINPKPLLLALPHLDAFNIDLKAFTEEFYNKYTKGSLAPVLGTLKTIAKSNAHLEITKLVIPGLNDDLAVFEKMVKWVSNELGATVPLHLSRYFPQHQLKLSPTPIKTLNTLYQIAKQHLHFVYLGNIRNKAGSSTFCTKCKELLISREGYQTQVKMKDQSRICPSCGTEIELIN